MFVYDLKPYASLKSIKHNARHQYCIVPLEFVSLEFRTYKLVPVLLKLLFAY